MERNGTTVLLVIAAGLMLLGLSGAAGGASSAAWSIGFLLLIGLSVRWLWRKSGRWAYRPPQDGDGDR